MMHLDISHHLRGKASRSRPLIESCLTSLVARCTSAVRGPAHCKVRVLKDHAGHTATHKPIQYVATIELIIPGWGHPFFARSTARRFRTAVADASESIETQLQRHSDRRKVARKSKPALRGMDFLQKSGHRFHAA